MAPEHLRLRNTDERYGVVCPDCAGPKTLQAAVCAQCFHDRQHDDAYWIRRTCDCGGPKSPRARTCKPCSDKLLIGNTHAAGHTNGPTHPWRRDLISRFDRREDMSANKETGTSEC